MTNDIYLESAGCYYIVGVTEAGMNKEGYLAQTINMRTSLLDHLSGVDGNSRDYILSLAEQKMFIVLFYPTHLHWVPPGLTQSDLMNFMEVCFTIMIKPTIEVTLQDKGINPLKRSLEKSTPLPGSLSIIH